MLDFAIFAVTFLVALVIAIIWLYPSSKKMTTIPGVEPSSKEDGNLPDLARAGSLHEYLLDLHGQYGPITGFWWGKTYVVSIAAPKLFKAHNSVFDRPPVLFKLFEPLIGEHSIQYANGADGRSRRKEYDRSFSHERLSTYYELIQQVTDGELKKWMKKDEHEHIPLCQEMFAFAIKSALLVLMGADFFDDKFVLSFKNAYCKAWAEMEHRLTDPTMPDETRKKSLKEALDYLKTSTKKVMNNRRNHSGDSDGGHLIDNIMGHSLNDEVAVSDIVSYLVGAFHTTANALTWCLYFLATHKDVQNKVYKEVIQVLGKDDFVSESNYGQFRYLKQVIDETLRCAVIAPWGARFQEFDTELGGHKIPKNTPVIHAIGVVLQDESLWPLPHKFDPDRFSSDQAKLRTFYHFPPFGFAGKRMCPGEKFAYLEAIILLSSLIRKFEVTMLEDQVVLPVYGLVTHPRDEIWVTIKKRV